MTIKELRAEKKLSQLKFAESVGVSSSLIGAIEQGSKKVSANLSAKVKEVYGVDLGEAKEVKNAVKAEEKPVSKPVERSKKVEKAPNANNYSLGVRSPFMTNTKVEKRPLGKDIPETSVSNLHSTKNIYSSKSPSKVTGKPAKKKHMVTEAPKKHSGWLWTLLVLFVIGAGAGLGYLAYILVFAK